MLSIIATLCSILLLMSHVSGQTDCTSPNVTLGACRGCDNDITGCLDATDQGCEYDFGDSTCRQTKCGTDCRLCDSASTICDNDPACWYAADNEQCRLKDTCASDCTFCNVTACASAGAGGGVCVIAGAGPNIGTCVGTTCDTNCESCDSGIESQCTNSRAPPNGCIFVGGNEGCLANTRNPTSDPTPEPTEYPTDHPTDNPTTAPTSSPNVVDTFIGCGEIETLTLPQNDVQTFVLVIPDDIVQVVITTCFDTTTFETALQLFDGQGDLIEDDIGSCGPPGNQSQIIVANGLPQSLDHRIQLSGVDPTQFGVYRIQILCETLEPSSNPTASPTTADPTAAPTERPTKNPSKAPTPRPTPSPTASPTFSPTMEPIEQLCPDCPFEAVLVEISDVEVKNCTEDTSEDSISDSDSDSGSGRKHYWNKRGGSSSGSRRRMLWGSDSSDSDSDSSSSSGYVPWNKKCIYPKGWGSGSSSSSDSDRRRSLLGKRWRSSSDSDSESSDGTDQGDEDDGGFSDWYTDKCFDDDDGDDSSDSSSSSSSDRRRRRRMMTPSFDGWGTRRQRTGRHLLSKSSSDSSSGSSSNGWAKWSKSDEFITEVCITYNVTDLVEDDSLICGEVRSLFLGLCENNSTDFNSSTIDAEDINNLIVSITPNDTLQAIGATEEDGTLGVFINFAQDSGVEQFELCLGNVTVDSEFNDNKEMIDIGNGTIRIIQDDGDEICPSDGLPCLNFFFDTPCPEVFTTTDDGKSCDCMGGLTEFTARYDGECNAKSIIVYLNGKLNNAVCEFNDVSPGDEILCASASADKDRFKRNTYITVECDDSNAAERRLLDSQSGDGDDSDNVDCVARFRTRCQTQIVGTQSEGCNDFTMLSTIDVEGSFCDEYELAEDEGTSNMNALSIGEMSINDPLEVFTSLDPYIQYTLIGLMITFVVLMFVACYICIGRNKLNENKNEDDKDNMDDNINDMNKHSSWSEYGGINQTQTDLVQDEEDDECYLSDNGQTHQQINTVDDSDDGDYYDTNGGHQNDNALVEMEIMKAVSNQ